jgi:predicted transposase/invertase (TIGR01784 family)
MDEDEKNKGEENKDSEIEVFMNPKTDFGFKKIFGEKQVLIAFLNTLEVLPKKIVDIEYLPSEQLGIIKANHKAVYDLYVKVKGGKRYIVEMQISRHDNFIERLLLYASYSIVYQSTSGKSVIKDEEGETVKEVDYNIEGVYVIAILDFVLFKEKEMQKTIIEQVDLMRIKANKRFTDKFRFLIIELPKFKKKLNASTTVMDKILYSLKYMDKLSERPEEMNENTLRLLYEAARINKLSEKEMETYHQSILEYYDVRQVANYAEKEGEKKGLRKGRKEGIEIGERRGIEIGEKRGIEIGEKRGAEIGEKRGIEIGEKRGIEIGEKQSIVKLIKNFYANNMSIEMIAKYTGFTEEQIHNILNNE